MKGKARRSQNEETVETRKCEIGSIEDDSNDGGCIEERITRDKVMLTPK